MCYLTLFQPTSVFPFFYKFTSTTHESIGEDARRVRAGIINAVYVSANGAGKLSSHSGCKRGNPVILIIINMSTLWAPGGPY